MAANKFISSLMSQYILKRGKAPDNHLISLLRKGLDTEWKRIYNEQRFYQAAYLMTLRKHLEALVGDYPAAEGEERVMKQVYEYQISSEVNEQTLEEHKIIVKGEFLEQLYYQFAGLHKVARNVEVIYPKSLYQRSTKGDLLDPNAFPFAAR